MIPVSSTENFSYPGKFSEISGRGHFDCIFLNSENKCKPLHRLDNGWWQRPLEPKQWKYIMKATLCPLNNLPISTCHRHSDVGQCTFYSKDELKSKLSPDHTQRNYLLVSPSLCGAQPENGCRFALGWKALESRCWVKEKSRLWSERRPAWAVNCCLNRFTQNVIVRHFNCL